MGELKRTTEENMRDKLAVAAIIIIGLSIGSCVNYATSPESVLKLESLAGR